MEKIRKTKKVKKELMEGFNDTLKEFNNKEYAYKEAIVEKLKNLLEVYGKTIKFPRDIYVLNQDDPEFTLRISKVKLCGSEVELYWEDDCFGGEWDSADSYSASDLSEIFQCAVKAVCENWNI